MKYISTRGGIAPISFTEAVMMGLATDGGLLLPEDIPVIAPAVIGKWRQLNYQELAFEVISIFATDIAADDLRSLIKRSYATFNDTEIVPIVKQGNVNIMELFHGPTLAFKDVALQFLGNVFEYLLLQSGQRMNILGATSGDTGSAAIYGVRGKKGINIFILHPHRKVSRIQELQMTTVTDANVFNIAVRGTFDDGQAIVKAIFNDIDFKERYQLGAVNSINWARILAQVVYYIYAALKVGAGSGRVDFAVPTGNFGDIFAGFVARRLLPDVVGKLILATNENDLLCRFVRNGDYSVGAVTHTSSPSMDIQIASNFERYLYFLNGCDAAKTKKDMEGFGKTGKLSFTPEQLQDIKAQFVARSVSQAETKATIGRYYKEGYTLDPHTAVGVTAAEENITPDTPMVCLATAHPAKFGDAVLAATGTEPVLPKALVGLMDKDSRCELLDADVKMIKDFVAEHAIGD